MSEKKYPSDHTRVFKIVPPAHESAGIGEESTESYVIFPSGSNDFDARIETSNALKALSTLQKVLRQRDIEVELDSLAANAATRVHTAALGGRRTMLLARSADRIAIANDHPISGPEEHRRAEELVSDVLDLTRSLESRDGNITVCLRDRRAYFIVEDGDWVALRAHMPRETGAVLSAIRRIANKANPLENRDFADR